MNTNLPISQADLEAMRIGSAHAADEMEWMITVDAVSGHLQATTDFRRALVKAGLLQGTGNVQPTAIYGTTLKLYSYDEIFSPKETTNGKTEDNRSQIDSAESHGQIRDSASLDCDPARNQPHQRDTAQNQGQPQETQSELRTGDLRRNPESDRGCSMSRKDKVKISVGEAYWVLGMFKKLESICLEINSLPMTLRPEIKGFRDRLRQKLREMEARERERAR